MLRMIEVVEALLLRLSIVTGFATLMIVLSIVADVGGRALFNSPVHGATEFSELLLVILVFTGLAAAQYNRQNFALDVLTRYLPDRAQSAIEHLGYLLCLVIVVLLAWLSTKQAINSFHRGETGFGIVPFPIWPARFVLAIGLWLLGLQFVCDIIRYLIG
ncbi:MAG: TRAP transporter small permease subunit, partial [Hyphomicrobiaceae bacterium]